jgi:hypothetical protein
MIDSTKSTLPREIKYFSAVLVLTAQLAGLPSLAGNWQGLVQTGINYAGRAAAAARSRAAHSSSGSDSGSTPAPSAEASVHADVIQPTHTAPPPTPPVQTSVTPPPAPPSSESSSGNYGAKWFGNNAHHAYRSIPEPTGVTSTTRSLQSGRPVQDIVPLSMQQQTRYNQLHNRSNKQKKPVVAHDTSPSTPELKADPNPAHRLTAENNDKPEHKVSPAPVSTAVDTSFVEPVLNKILARLKS